MDENNNNEITNDKITIEDERSAAISHKDSALKRLDLSFNKHIEAKEYKKSHLLSYWITDFSNYHDEEKTFDSSSLKTFKRGDIVKVNLGFNIGNELGGLHYCVVLNKNDNPYSGTLNVIPLSSFKENKKFNDSTCINLGDELYNLLSTKCNNGFEQLRREMSNLQNIHDMEEVKAITNKLEYLNKLQKEVDKMKHGSYALVHQITTISKQRLHKTSILSRIKVSNNSLNLIDEKIKKIYTK